MVVALRKTGDVVVPWRVRLCKPHPWSVSHAPSSPWSPCASRDRSRTEKIPRRLSAKTREAFACLGVTHSGPVAQSPYRAIERHNLQLSWIKGGDRTEHASFWASLGEGQY